MQYDFQIIVPCKKERKKLFQKLGIINLNKKTLLYCFVEHKNDFLDGWPKNLDIEIIEYPNKNENFRIYDFLSKQNEEFAKQAKWTMKIDDDSFTNIDLLYENIERYNYLENHYLVGPPVRINDLNKSEINALINVNLLEKLNNTWDHEVECCLFSQSALCKMLKNEDCKKIFKEFARMNQETREGFTDQIMGAAAKLCKIYPKEENSLIYGGRIQDIQHIKSYSHFHPADLQAFKKIHQKLKKNFIVKINNLDIEIIENKIY